MPGTKKAAYLITVILIILGIAAFSMHYRSDLFSDEGHTYRVITAPEFLKALQEPSMCHPPLSFILSKVSFVLAGGRPFWIIRVPGILAAASTLLLLAHLAGSLIGVRAKLACTALCLLSPGLYEFSTEARPYALHILLSAAFLVAFLAYLKEDSWKNTVFLVLAGVVGFFNYYAFAFNIAAAGLIYLFMQRRITKTAVVAAATMLGTMLVVFMTFMMDDLYHSKALGEQISSSPMNVLATLPFATYFGYSTFRLPTLNMARAIPLDALASNIVPLSAAVVFFVALVLCAGRNMRRVPALAPVILMIVLPVVFALLAGYFHLYALRAKYLVGIHPACMILLVLVLFGEKKRLLKAVLVLSFLIPSGISLYHYAVHPEIYSRRMYTSDMLSFLKSQVSPRDAVVTFIKDYENMTPGLDFSQVYERVRFLSLDAEADAKRPLGDVARELDHTVTGRIFVVNYETARHLVDPDNRFEPALGDRRSPVLHYFGRNLFVIVYSPPAPSPGGTGS